MNRLNIAEAKKHLSRYLARVEKGESFILCRRNAPIAEIRPIPKRKRPRGHPGHWAGQFEVTRAFFEPLPDDPIDALEGEPEE